MKINHCSTVTVVAASILLLMAGCDGPNEADERIEALAEEEERAINAQELREDSTIADLTVDDGEASSFARERGISVEVARLRLARQSLAPGLAVAVDDRLGEVFGGAWIDIHDGDEIKIGVTSLRHGEAEVVRRAAGEVGLTGGYSVVEVRHSMAALEAANNVLADALIEANAGEGASLTVGLRTDLNAVELQAPVDGALTPVQERLLVSAREQFGDMLLIGSYRGRPETRACVYPHCDPPLRGGVKITGSKGSCTAAFVARSNTDLKWYQFTAGHCLVDTNSNWSTAFTDKSQHVIGASWNAVFNTTGDVGILKVNNPLGWNPKPWVNVTSGPDTTGNSSYVIKSDSPSLIGMRICTTGASYGRSDCGFVTHQGVTAKFSGSGVTVKNLGRASYCSKPGDSGAPIFASGVAYGLQVGGYVECDTLYQSIRAGELLMNVSVSHG